MEIESFQDQVDWHCYGCGRLNEHGFQIKSRWEGDVVVCRWQAQPFHVGLPGRLQGGVIATAIICHALWTATATACRDEGIVIEEPMPFAYSTTSLQVDFLEPIPLDGFVTLRAHARRRGLQRVMRAPLCAACLRVSTFWIRHSRVLRIPLHQPLQGGQTRVFPFGRARARAGVPIRAALRA